MNMLRILCLLLVMTLLVAACVAIAEQPASPTLDDFIEPDDPITPTPTNPPAPTSVPEPKSKTERLTGVILGGDWDPNRPERVRFGIRSDVFVIYSALFNEEFGVVDLRLISLPRDLFISVPCSPLDPVLKGYDRINSAYAYGRFDCVRETLEELGLEINAPIFYTELRSFVYLVNRFGGINITPGKTYSDWCGEFNGTETIQEQGVLRTWYEGVEYWMDGNHALCYVRARAMSGDLDRNRRALEMLKAMLAQYPGQIFNSGNRMDAINEIWGTWQWASKHVDSDLTLGHVTKYGGYGLDLLQGAIPLTFHRMPPEAVRFYTTPIYKASVLIPKVDMINWLQCTLTADDTQICFELTLCDCIYEFEEPQ